MYRVVDAWGSGPYSVTGQELGWLWESHLASFGGEVVRPPWVATVGTRVDDNEKFGTFVTSRASGAPTSSARSPPFWRTHTAS